MIALVLAVLSLALQDPSTRPTLREVVAKHVPVVPDADDLDRRISDHSVLDTPSWFAIGYYWDPGAQRTLGEIRVRTYDKRARRWRAAVFTEDLGTIVDLRRHQALFYVTGHLSPSAAPTLVLSNDLELIRLLEGWPTLPLADGRMVFQDNMTHFAPAHPASLSVYDPSSDEVRRVYPVKPDENRTSVRGDGSRVSLLIDRSIISVTPERGRTIAITLVERTVTLERSNTGTPGPERRFVVRCDMSDRRAACAEPRPAPAPRRK